jgi:hypothetical protein
MSWQANKYAEFWAITNSEGIFIVQMDTIPDMGAEYGFGDREAAYAYIIKRYDVATGVTGKMLTIEEVKQVYSKLDNRRERREWWLLVREANPDSNWNKMRKGLIP